MTPLEIICDTEGVELAYILKANWMPEKTEFLTPNHFGQQLGLIVYGAKKSITPHVHLPVTREVKGTSETIIVRKGACAIDLYDSQKQFLCSRDLRLGDVVLLIAGGHGFRMHEDTVLLEVKQGPYLGYADKERFG